MKDEALYPCLRHILLITKFLLLLWILIPEEIFQRKNKIQRKLLFSMVLCIFIFILDFG